jgi:hypothetical protein
MKLFSIAEFLNEELSEENLPERVGGLGDGWSSSPGGYAGSDRDRWERRQARADREERAAALAAATAKNEPARDAAAAAKEKANDPAQIQGEIERWEKLAQHPKMTHQAKQKIAYYNDLLVKTKNRPIIQQQIKDYEQELSLTIDPDLKYFYQEEIKDLRVQLGEALKREKIAIQEQTKIRLRELAGLKKSSI